MPRLAGGGPSPLTALREELVSLGVRSLASLRGGDLSEAWRAELADGTTAFVKSRAGSSAAEWQSEADGLRWLAAANELRLPHVLAVGEHFLALEWIEPGSGLSTAGEAELGRGLAGLHDAGADAFGGEQPLTLGPLMLPNGPSLPGTSSTQRACCTCCPRRD